MNEETLERLELKLAYMERANQDLSDVVYRQQREIAALRDQIAALVSRVESMRTEGQQYTAEQERPPHY